MAVQLELKDNYGRTIAKGRTSRIYKIREHVDHAHEFWKLVLANMNGKNYTGYVKKSFLDELNVSTVAIPANFAGLEAVSTPTRLEDQYFDITEVVENEDYVEVTAEHIFYRMRQNNTLWKPTENTLYTGAAAMRNIMTNAVSELNFDAASDCTDTLQGSEMDYERKNIVEALLDPNSGLCAKYGLSLIRDNDVFYCLKEVGYDRGMIIQNEKNLLGVERRESIENVITRVAAYGKDERGNILWLNYNGKKYIDSPHINDYAEPKLEIFDTGLQINKDDVTSRNIQDKMLAAARKRFSEDKIDIPELTMTIEFLSLGDTEEYAQYRGLDKVYLYDILTVKDTVRGYDYSAQVIGVEHDILTGALLSVTIGSVTNANDTRKVATWQMPEIDGANIRLKSIMSGSFEADAIQADDIATGAVHWVHLDAASITELTTEQFEALQADIHELIAGTIRADDIEAGSITAEKIAADAITAEKISADAITASKIDATDVDAINAKLGTATVADGYIQNADIDFAHVKDMSVDHAVIETSITEQGIGNKLFINRLMVTYGQMVEATIGDLVIGASNGNYYHVDVSWDSDGVPTLVPTQVSVTGAEIADGKTTDGKTIIGDVGTYAELSSTDFYAINGIIDRITAKRIDVDQLFAREATIQNLNTVNISNNQYIGIAVRDQLGVGKAYYQTTEPASGENGDLWYKIVTGAGAVKWQDLETKTWQELESLVWQQLGDEYYQTYRYDNGGWQLIDGYTQAQLDITNNAILAEVQRATGAENGKLDKTTNYQTADSIVTAAVSQAGTAAGNTYIAKTQTLQTADAIVTEAVSQAGTAAGNTYIAKTQTLQTADAIVTEAVNQSATAAGNAYIAKTQNLQTADAIVLSATQTSATYADGVAGTAETNAKSYADGVAGTAETNAKSYADGAAGTAETNAKSYADGAAGTAETNAKSYADGAAGTAETNAKTYADGAAGTAESNANNYTDTHAYAIQSGIEIRAAGVQVTGNKYINLDVNTNNYVHINDTGIAMQGSRVSVNGKDMWARDDIVVVKSNETVAQIEQAMAGKTDWVMIRPFYDSSISCNGSTGITGGATGDSVIISNYTQVQQGQKAFGDGAEYYNYTINLTLYNTSSSNYQKRIKAFLSNRPFSFVSSSRESEAQAQADIVIDLGTKSIVPQANNFTLASGNVPINLFRENATVYYYLFGITESSLFNLTANSLTAGTAATTWKVPCTVYYYH